MQNKIPLLRFFPFTAGRPTTNEMVATRAAAEPGLDIAYAGFDPLYVDGKIKVLMELHNHLTNKYDYEECYLELVEGMTELYMHTIEVRGVEYRLVYNNDSTEFYAHPSKWVSNMGKFLVCGTYRFRQVDTDGELRVEVTSDMFNLPWVPHALKTDPDLDPVPKELYLLCLQHGDWAHSQALLECPNIEPMLHTIAALDSSFHTVEGVTFSFGPQPIPGKVYIHAMGRALYTVVSCHNGRAILLNNKTKRRYVTTPETFKNEFISGGHGWSDLLARLGLETA